MALVLFSNLPPSIQDVIYVGVIAAVICFFVGIALYIGKYSSSHLPPLSLIAGDLLPIYYVLFLLLLLWTPLNLWRNILSLLQNEAPEIKMFQFCWETIPYTFIYLLSFRWIGTFHFYKNVILLIPMGIILPLKSERIRTWKHFFIAIIVLSIILESGQIFSFGRSFDCTDVLAYILGGAGGFALHSLLRKQSVCFIGR